MGVSGRKFYLSCRPTCFYLWSFIFIRALRKFYSNNELVYITFHSLCWITPNLLEDQKWSVIQFTLHGQFIRHPLRITRHVLSLEALEGLWSLEKPFCSPLWHWAVIFAVVASLLALTSLIWTLVLTRCFQQLSCHWLYVFFFNHVIVCKLQSLRL